MAKWVSVDDEKKPEVQYKIGNGLGAYFILLQDVEISEFKNNPGVGYPLHDGTWEIVCESPWRKKYRVTHWLDELTLPE